jgi:hypothetical protein
MGTGRSYWSDPENFYYEADPDPDPNPTLSFFYKSENFLLSFSAMPVYIVFTFLASKVS